MKAAILEKLNAPLVVAGGVDPGPLQHGQVLVRVLVAGICGAQLQEIRGDKGNPDHLPHLLGHEGCGIVEEVGPGVKHVKPGDKVVLHWRKGYGCDVAGSIYTVAGGVDPGPPAVAGGVDPGPASTRPATIKSGPVTCFSEYTIVSENRVTPVPEDFPSDLACLLGCCLSTALATIENETRWGQSILIIGCGGVGLSFAFAARLNYLQVSVTDIYDSKVAYAISIAPARTSNCSGEFDVIVDTAGHCSFLDRLAPGGKYIMVGQPSGFVTPRFDRHMFDGAGKTIKATQGGCFSPGTDIPRYVKLWRSGALDGWWKLITHRVSLDDINRGLDLVRDGKAGRVLIDISK